MQSVVPNYDGDPRIQKMFKDLNLNVGAVYRDMEQVIVKTSFTDSFEPNQDVPDAEDEDKEQVFDPSEIKFDIREAEYMMEDGKCIAVFFTEEKTNHDNLGYWNIKNLPPYFEDAFGMENYAELPLTLSIESVKKDLESRGFTFEKIDYKWEHSD